jgi:gliding motility associated protien GldN
MKPIYTIGLILFFLAYSSPGFSQNTPQRPTRQRASEAAAAVDNSSTLTERAKIKNEVTSKAPTHVAWLREMYRIIDLEQDNNAALYYPVQPIGERMNLFTTIFKLLADGKITAYNYLLNRQEVFTDAEIHNFEETLKSHGIPFQKQGSVDNPRYIVEDFYIPSDEVLEYQIKEGWYFDAATGSYKSRVIAICPVLVQTDYNVGGVEKTALFWIPYENLRPYLSRTMIMTSDYNNVMTYSIDDFFSKGMYKGNIIKTVNMRDLTLAQQVIAANPEVQDNSELMKEYMKLAQDSIDNQLKAFREQLWVRSDTTQIAVTNKNVKKTTTTAKKEKEEKPKAAKPEKSSAPASTTKSVRRTR